MNYGDVRDHFNEFGMRLRKIEDALTSETNNVSIGTGGTVTGGSHFLRVLKTSTSNTAVVKADGITIATLTDSSPSFELPVLKGNSYPEITVSSVNGATWTYITF